MTMLRVELNYTCHACGGEVGVTVDCRIGGLPRDDFGLAAVTVPCPNCGECARVAFSPATGTVVRVEDANPVRGRALQWN